VLSDLAGKNGRLPIAAQSEGPTSFSVQFKKNTKSSRQLGKKHPSPRCNSVAVKDGRLRTAARSEGLTSLSERSKKNAKSSRQSVEEECQDRRFLSLRMVPRTAANSGKSTLHHALTMKHGSFAPLPGLKA